jgi:hypothetical protein
MAERSELVGCNLEKMKFGKNKKTEGACAYLFFSALPHRIAPRFCVVSWWSICLLVSV